MERLMAVGSCHMRLCLRLEVLRRPYAFVAAGRVPALVRGDLAWPFDCADLIFVR